MKAECSCRDCYEKIESDGGKKPKFCSDCIKAGCPNKGKQMDFCLCPDAYDFDCEEDC